MEVVMICAKYEELIISKLFISSRKIICFQMES